MRTTKWNFSPTAAPVRAAADLSEGRYDMAESRRSRTTRKDRGSGSDTSMKAKRMLKQPLLWVLLAFVGLMLALNLTGGSDYQRIDTSQAVKLINDGQVE